MNIRGLQKFTLVDYPGKIACIVFVGECNFRCPYCHNPCLVFDPESQPLLPEKEVFRFLEQRRGKLEGVVVSGGEPTLRPGLPEFVGKAKKMGFLVKIDTNGSMPGKIFQIYQKTGLDALGVDYKGPAARYAEITHAAVPEIAAKVQSVIRFAVEKNIPVDVRTTVHKRILSAADLAVMKQELAALGITAWTLQQFNPVEIIDDSLLTSPTYADSELLKIAGALGGNVHVRGLKGIVIEE